MTKADQCASFPQTTTLQGDTPASHEINLGSLYENEDRLPDAEKAYAKALETATGADLPIARRHLECLLRKEEQPRTKYAAPSFEEASLGVWKTIVSTFETGLVLALLWICAQTIRRLGERFGKNKVQIADFIDATGEGGATAFAEQLRYAIETVQDYYRIRDPFRLGSFSSLLVMSGPEPDKMVDLATDLVSSPLGKVFSFFATGFFRPQYKISGMVQKTGPYYSCWVKVYRRKLVLGAWQRKFQAQQCIAMQEQLAYEVVLRLKEEVDVN